MARINNGILGGINGNLGPVEGYVRYGIPYITPLEKKKNNLAIIRDSFQSSGKLLFSVLCNYL